MSRRRQKRRQFTTSATPTVRRSPPQQRRLVTSKLVSITPAFSLYAAARVRQGGTGGQRSRPPRREVESGYHDRREWRPPQAVERTAVSLGKTRQPDRLQDPNFDRPHVRDPKRVLTCARRNQRKQVMFATGKGGARGRQRTRRRLNPDSEIRCR